MTSRIVVYATLGILFAYDLVCAIAGYPTITSQVRYIDNQCGGLIRWGWIALWLHFWGPFWTARGHG
jgi:uncharacterized membrane protein YuzA (DUF378 family)